jgi:hypothetical protein
LPSPRFSSKCSKPWNKECLFFFFFIFVISKTISKFHYFIVK